MTTETHHRWIKSSYSNNGGDCLEVAVDLSATGTVPVRDSKRPTGPILTLSPAAFAGLVAFARGSVVSVFGEHP
ncbi:hypothetical protein GCM10010387_12400 [Streptomyces inusitatus]|uniref:DUF397 domain-containing protein n=1 Tax=Streptomyces inusitatus TaxID=68221 RepID=A0A918ULR7_9ACTN|nr:DUF397 domain-containing protein [Streptomyces inusitatus]GGZ20927.1 hypothetical protein GCM10010387_12400 [Streptomyces inusitatus]